MAVASVSRVQKPVISSLLTETRSAVYALICAFVVGEPTISHMLYSFLLVSLRLSFVPISGTQVDAFLPELLS